MAHRPTPDQLPSPADPAATLVSLLRFAVLAPSGHNTQPWLFRVRGETVDVFADRAQALAVVDPDDRELTISVGAALCNLRVALRRFAFRDDAYEVFPRTDTPDLLASVHLVAGEPPSPEEEALFMAIERRRTTRAAYGSGAVPATAEAAIERAAGREGAWLHVVADSERDAVAGLVAEGDRRQMHDKRFRRELASWVHHNRSRSAQGMRGDGFGVGDLASLAGPLVIRRFDPGKRQAAADRALADHAPLLAVVGTDRDEPRDWLAAGQALERVNLVACAHGLTSSYLNQPVEVEELRGRLADAIGHGGRHPQVVLRVGEGPEVRRAARKSVAAVMVEPGGGGEATRDA